MITTVIFVLLALMAILLLVWLSRRATASSARPAPPTAIEELSPRHCARFPQIRQALQPADESYMRERASEPELRRWRAERQRILRQYVLGLKDDYLRLVQLRRAVVRLSPRVKRTQEFEFLWLRLRFAMLHEIVALRLTIGRAPDRAVHRLLETVGSLASQVEAAMSALEETSRTRLRAGLSA